MNFQHVNDFATADPERLARQLSNFEDKVDKAIDDARADAVPLLQPVTFRSLNAVAGVCAAMFDQQLSLDTSFASAAVVFPALDPKNFGRRVVLIKRTANNNLVTSCQEPTVLCNGAAFPTLTAVGAYVFYCDASGYYR